MKSAYGADLSLNHGAVVLVEMGKKNQIFPVSSVLGWDKKDSHKLTTKSTHEELHQKVKDIIVSISAFSRVNEKPELVVDWTPTAVHWRTKKSFIVIMGVFMGMLYEQTLAHNIKFTAISPSVLRQLWGLRNNAPKEELQLLVLSAYPPPVLFNTWAKDDDIDAYILAVTIILNREKNDNS